MKKKNPLKEIAYIFIGSFLIISLFSVVGTCCVKKNRKPQESISYNDNCQLNEIEQYHRSQGRSIIVFE